MRSTHRFTNFKNIRKTRRVYKVCPEKFYRQIEMLENIPGSTERRTQMSSDIFRAIGVVFNTGSCFLYTNRKHMNL